MRSCFSLLVLLVVGFVSGCVGVGPGSEHPRPRMGTFFVATNGDDDWSGTVAAATTNHDGPFRTLPRALRAVVDLKKEQGGAWKQPVFIYVRGGTHWLDEPVVINAKASGTKNTPLVIAAFPGEKPVLSAGRPISGWKAVTVNGKSLWAAEVPDARNQDWFFHQLWVGGERRTRARHPNSGYLQIENLPDATSSWEEGHKRFRFRSGDLKAWPSASEGEAVVMTRWVDSRLPIASIDEKSHLLTGNKQSVFQLQAGDPYYIEHVFEALDAPGEWFLDRKAGVLYYQPLPGEILKGFEAIAPRLMHCVRIEGHPENNEAVEHVEFRGLTFSHNEWYFPPGFGSEERHISTTPNPNIFGFAQAAFGVHGAIRAEGAHQCVFAHCRFTNIGSYGLQLGRGCQSNLVSGCEFGDLAAGGIRLGETLTRSNVVEQAFGNEVSDCHIHDGGKMFASGEGIWIGQSFGNRISHNAIHDFFYTGVSIGWTWGYKGSLASNNIVEFNEVHHIGRKANGDGPILSDMGGIYTLGIQPGTIIRNNYWHDIQALRYGGWGIYFDEGSSGILAENNLVLRTTHGGFHQHYGKENIIRNNVFGFGRDAQLQRTRAEDHSSFTFEKNIVYFNEGKLLEGDWSGGKFNQDNNVYFDARTNTMAKMNFPGGWDKWRSNGHDLHSMISDARFVWLDDSSFSAQPKPPGCGFRQFDFKTIGPRSDSYLK